MTENQARIDARMATEQVAAEPFGAELFNAEPFNTEDQGFKLLPFAGRRREGWWWRYGLVGLTFVAPAIELPKSMAAEMHSVLERPVTPIVYDGIIQPRYDILVAALEDGRLLSIDVRVGDHVQAGQVIGRLDDALQRSAVEIATLQSAMTGERDATRAEVELNQRRAGQIEALARDGAARPDELQRSRSELEMSTARYTAALEQHELRQLELARYRIQLERRNIRAPMAGVIAKVLRKPGEYISPGDPSIAQLLVVDQLSAVFNIPIEEVKDIRIGSPTKVTLRSTSRVVDAVVTSIAPNIDGESGTVQVKVELDNADGKMLAGDRCTLEIQPHLPGRVGPNELTNRKTDRATPKAAMGNSDKKREPTLR